MDKGSFSVLPKYQQPHFIIKDASCDSLIVKVNFDVF